MKRLVAVFIAASMAATVLVDHAAAREGVGRPRIVITARPPPFYWGLGPGGYWGPGPAWYRETHPALFCWYAPCWSGRGG
jgi:hypothetical protein